MSAVSRVARCSCGQLQALCTGEPSRVLMCHCTECQRRTGSVFGVGAYFLRERVEISGAATTYQRSSDSGRYLRSKFCPACGTTLYWELDVFPDLLGVATGAFTDPTLPPPQLSLWTQHRPEWVQLADSIEALPQGSASGKAKA